MILTISKWTFWIVAGLLFLAAILVLIGKACDGLLLNFFNAHMRPEYLDSWVQQAFVPSIVYLVVGIFGFSIYFLSDTLGRTYR